ncbi:MAG TPA: hypothetical protein ENH87_19095 [Pricia antarctica]|uniref:Uncharacterized protein n=2 Tax=root TaxID=1 RepID=A0A831QTE0_9FLAO|nr:hypothetical protein [Pricia antarctica]
MEQEKAGNLILKIKAAAEKQYMIATERLCFRIYVLATDLAVKILEFAFELTQVNGLDSIEIPEMDGENLILLDGSLDTLISREGLNFSDQKYTLKEI